MLRYIGLCIGLALAGNGAVAQDVASFTVGHDVYLAGNAPSFTGDATTEDLFVVGQHVTVQAPVKGAAHLAGRRIEVSAAVGGDLFAAGYSVNVAAPVAGDANLAGFEVTLAQGVGGNLRAGGNEVTLGGIVGGLRADVGRDDDAERKRDGGCGAGG